MKKVYLIYAKIPALLFDNKMHLFVNDSSKYKYSNRYYIGLYAWTTSKILLDTFMDFRKDANKIYKLKIRKFSKNELNVFKDIHQNEELRYYRISSCANYNDIDDDGWIPKKKDSKKDRDEFFSKDGVSSQIVCTKEEYNTLFDFGHQYLYEYMTQIINADYYAFKDEYKLALDYIGYCDTFNDLYDGLEDYDKEDSFYSSRHELTSYNRQFGMSYYGNPYIDVYENKLALFINIFYEMILGYKDGDEIKLLVYR